MLLKIETTDIKKAIKTKIALLQMGGWSVKTNTDSYIVVENNDATEVCIYVDPTYIKRLSDITREVPCTKDKVDIIDITNFKPSYLTNMDDSFAGFSSITEIRGLENLNTSYVTTMSNVFDGCTELKSINLSNFKTSNVTNMANMFLHCDSLAQLNLSSFDVSNVQNMSGMFMGCISLKTIVIDKFEAINCKDLSKMFYSDTRLYKIDTTKIHTELVENLASMFSGTNIPSIDLSNMHSNNVSNLYMMFYGAQCKTVKFSSKFNTSEVTDMHSMFDSCNCLENVDLSSFEFHTRADLRDMFHSCYKLKTLKIPKLSPTKMMYVSPLITAAYSIDMLDLSGFDVEKLKNNVDYFNDSDVDEDGNDNIQIRKMLDVPDINLLILTGPRTDYNTIRAFLYSSPARNIVLSNSYSAWECQKIEKYLSKTLTDVRVYNEDTYVNRHKPKKSIWSLLKPPCAN